VGRDPKPTARRHRRLALAELALGARRAQEYYLWHLVETVRREVRAPALLGGRNVAE
jgi:hypothetical protein